VGDRGIGLHEELEGFEAGGSHRGIVRREGCDLGEPIEDEERAASR